MNEERSPSMRLGITRDRSAPVRLARVMARAIIEQALPVGSHLGSLSEIAESHGVSVPTLRKAITYLLEDGFVLAREGRGGGLIVAAPPSQTAMRAMYLFISELALAPAQIEEVRELINTTLAERALRLVNAADQRHLESLFAQARSFSAPTADTIRAFDEAILTAAKQPVLALISRVLDRLDPECRPADDHDLREELGLRRELARAIVGGRLADAILLWRGLRPIADKLDIEAPPSARLPNQIATAIKTMISERHMSPGDELGDEKAMQQQFGVGRSTLRDALRPLERSGAIKISNGRGGGIFVGSAEPYAAAEMASLYLSSIRLSFREQAESREVLESRAAWLAAEQLPSELRPKLEAAMRADALAVSMDLDDWAAKGAQVERLIAHASQNPLLEFFTLALIDLSVAQASRQGALLDISHADLASRVSRHHGEIVEAILAGLPAKAAFKTREYLKDLGRWVG